MMLRNKDESLRLTARDPRTGETWTIRLLDYITERQIEACADRPDMVLQLCRHIAVQWRRENGRPLEVFVRARASLNGRPMQPLIDPNVNLAAEPRNLRHAQWILPLKIPLGTANPPKPATRPS